MCIIRQFCSQQIILNQPIDLRKHTNIPRLHSNPSNINSSTHGRIVTHTSTERYESTEKSEMSQRNSRSSTFKAYINCNQLERFTLTAETPYELDASWDGEREVSVNMCTSCGALLTQETAGGNTAGRTGVATIKPYWGLSARIGIYHIYFRLLPQID